MQDLLRVRFSILHESNMIYYAYYRQIGYISSKQQIWIIMTEGNNIVYVFIKPNVFAV